MFRGSMRGSRDEHRKQRQQKFFYLLSDGTLKKQKVVAKLREIANSIGRETEVLKVLEKLFLLRE